MKTPTPVLLGLLVLFTIGHAAGADSPARGVSNFPPLPWFGNHPLPAESEKHALQTARNTAELDPAIVDLKTAYTAKWVLADDSIRILMLENPASKPFIQQIVMGQLIHEKVWFADWSYNNRDILLPNANWDPVSDAMGIIVTKASGQVSDDPPSARSAPPSDSLEGIRSAALADKNIQQLLQSVRDAYQKLDQAVRASMQTDPSTKALMDKYDFLLYGRKDLGYMGGTYIQG